MIEPDWKDSLDKDSVVILFRHNGRTKAVVCENKTGRLSNEEFVQDMVWKARVE